MKPGNWMTGAIAALLSKSDRNREFDFRNRSKNLPRATSNSEARRLEGLALEFYQLVRSTPHRLLPPALQNFPTSCGLECSLLFSKYLREVGYGRMALVFGSRGSHSHVWLEIYGLVADLTVEQFAEVDRPRSFVTDCHPWYESWKVIDFVDTNSAPIDLPTHQQLLRTYSTIVG